MFFLRHFSFPGRILFGSAMDESAVDAVDAVDESLLNLKRSLRECNHELTVPDAQPYEVQEVWDVPESSSDSCTRALRAGRGCLG